VVALGGAKSCMESPCQTLAQTCEEPHPKSGDPEPTHKGNLQITVTWGKDIIFVVIEYGIGTTIFRNVTPVVRGRIWGPVVVADDGKPIYVRVTGQVAQDAKFDDFVACSITRDGKPVGSDAVGKDVDGGPLECRHHGG